MRSTLVTSCRCCCCHRRTIITIRSCSGDRNKMTCRRRAAFTSSFPLTPFSHVTVSYVDRGAFTTSRPNERSIVSAAATATKRRLRRCLPICACECLPKQRTQVVRLPAFQLLVAVLLVRTMIIVAAGRSGLTVVAAVLLELLPLLMAVVSVVRLRRNSSDALRALHATSSRHQPPSGGKLNNNDDAGRRTWSKQYVIYRRFESSSSDGCAGVDANNDERER